MLFLTTLLLLGTAVLGQLPIHQSTPTYQIPSQPIPPNQLPYQAKIYLEWSKPFFQSSAEWDAVLIGPEWLLTSAESFLSFPPLKFENLSLDSFYETMDVFIGFNKVPSSYKKSMRLEKECESGRVKRRVVGHFRSPRVEIGNRTQDSDLLLLKLDRAVPTWSNMIKPIELPEVGTRWTNRTAVVSGYGRTALDYHLVLTKWEPRPNTLQYTKVPILSKRECLAMFRKNLPVDSRHRMNQWHDDSSLMSYEELRLKVAPETILCAEFEVGGHNSCLGHSGGPLAVCATPLRETTSGGQQLCEGNRWQLAGFLSEAFFYYCSRQSKLDGPAIFTNVAPFSDWIRRTINNN